MDFNLWMEVLQKPKDVFKAQKGKGDIGKGVMNFAIAYLIVGVIYAIFAIAVPVAAVTILFSTLIGGIIGSFIGVGVLYLVAMLLGGKGSFEDMYYLLSIFAAPITILGIIPFVGFLASLYGLYLLTLAIMEVHGFDTLKAVLVWLIPAIVVGVLVAVVFAAFFATLFGAGAFGAMGGKLPY
ncbi:MAG: YIP1 family protein [Candidatus Micrarchaeota archaeon]